MLRLISGDFPPEIRPARPEPPLGVPSPRRPLSVRPADACQSPTTPFTAPVLGRSTIAVRSSAVSAGPNPLHLPGGGLAVPGLRSQLCCVRNAGGRGRLTPAQAAPRGPSATLEGGSRTTSDGGSRSAIGFWAAARRGVPAGRGQRSRA